MSSEVSEALCEGDLATKVTLDSSVTEQLDTNMETEEPVVDSVENKEENTTEVKDEETVTNGETKETTEIEADKVEETSKESDRSTDTPETDTTKNDVTAETAASSEEDTGESSVPNLPTKAQIKCVFCDIVLSRADRPMLLECLHSACATCIDAKLQEQPDQEQEVMDSNAVLCPWCSITSDRTNLIMDRFVLEACPGVSQAGGSTDEDAAEAAVCVSCDENVPASSFCEDCSELLCDACVQAHRRVRVTKDHSIVEKGQARQQRRSSTNQDLSNDFRCMTHPAESMTLYCEKCDRLTCRDCQLTEHREHRYKFVDEIAVDARAHLSSLLNEVTYKRGLLESAVKVIDKRQTAINEKKQQVVQDITKLVILLTNAISGRGKQLVQRLGEVCENKQRTLADKRTTLQQLTRLTDHCIKAVSTQLDNGSDLALLWSKKTIMRHLQRIKCRRADIPNPDIPVRIHFAQQRVDTLCNALATVGGIVVDGRAYPSNENPTDVRSVRSPGLNQTATPVHPPPPQPAHHNQPHPQHGQSAAATAPHQLVHHRPAVHMQQQPQPHHQQVGIRPPGSSHQVSSSTHPGVQQLRTLLSPSAPVGTPPIYMRPMSAAQLPNLRPLNMPPPAQQQLQLQVQGTLRAHGVRLPTHRPPPPLTPANPMPSSIASRAPVWHIPPDRSLPMGQNSTPPQPPVPNDNFRITLTNQWLHASEQVSSSGIQRSTPSPAASSNCKVASDPAVTLDSFCQKSMDDLLSTIATMDDVKKPTEATTSSLVDSSTGSPSQRLGTAGASQNSMSLAKDDPNEDWCAVCMDGGDLVCCDRCPKVFHSHCHIPQLGSLAETPDSWQCLLCTPIKEILQTPLLLHEEGVQKMNVRQLRIAQRLLLELYCQYDHSQPFREPVSVEMFPDYPRVVEHPMSLDVIKKRLDQGHTGTYTDMQDFINDVRLIFKNAYAFNPKGTAVYNEAQALEDVFEGMLNKWLPPYASTTRLYQVTQEEPSAAVDGTDDGASKRKKPRLD